MENCNSNPIKCTCNKSDTSSGSDNSTSETSTHKDKKSKISLTSLGFSLRRGKSLHFPSKRNKKSNQTDNNSPSTSNGNVKKSPKWGLKFSCTKNKEPKVTLNQDSQSCCRCNCPKKSNDELVTDSTSVCSQTESVDKVQAEEVVAAAGDVAKAATGDVAKAATGTAEADAATGATAVGAAAAAASPTPSEPVSTPEPAVENVTEASEIDCNVGIYGTSVPAHIIINGPMFEMTWIASVHEDLDVTARLARAREIEQGVEAPANFRQVRRLHLVCSDVEAETGQATKRFQFVCPPDLSMDSLRALFKNHVFVKSCPLDTTGCHTQVDFIHCLVPDLLNITNCSFYWGKMDRYEAERLLDGKPEGTFLLRDSAQEEFLFSVSFRKYGRSLHARIEQWNHKFSFDAHDPGVYTSDTVCGLIEHYKDPSSCMFFEPMLTWPLHRNFTFSLQHLCRAAIVNRLTYDDINNLQLPKTLKNYMKEYHYRQKVRVARFDDDAQWWEVRNVPP